MTLKMPAHVIERARALVHGGNWQPPLPRDATTVVLVRDGESGLEVCLLRRSQNLPFAPGVHVFPGGAVDPADFDLPLDGTVDGIRLSAAPDLAAALVLCGVRETFEEVGVLLARGASGDDVVPDAEWEADRATAATHGMSDIIARRNLVLNSDALRPIAHWVTPEVETRRYDVRFLLARMPAGQEVRVDGSEIVAGVWVTPAAALVGADNGEYPMLPPTRAVLATLASADDVDAAFEIASAQQIRPLMPAPIPVGDDLGWVLIDAYTREQLVAVDMPAGSEVEGRA